MTILLRLTCISGPLKGKVVDVSAPVYVAGRLPSSNLVLPSADALASRVHARIESKNGRPCITDMNSTNGTWLNGMRLEPFKPCSLNNGDSVRMGSSTFSIGGLARPSPVVQPGPGGSRPAGRDEKSTVTIIEKIAIGGMSVIYTARFADTSQVVVMKVPDEDSAQSPEVLKLFEREIVTGLHLRHPNVIQILMRIDFRGLPAMIMEYFPSQPLNTLIAGGSLDARQKLSVLSQVCDGLAYIHSRGIVHDDIKPGNVLVGRGGVTKITDFGTAGTPASLKTAKDQFRVLGTTLYMSPEQIQGRDIDSRVDIYGLGIITYELLTGVNPFFKEGNNSAAEIMERQLSLIPAPPSSVLANIPTALDELVMQSLTKDPWKRIQTAQEFKNAIQRAWRQR